MSTHGERRLFGTDGIRGTAGEFPLDRRTVAEIGRALGRHLARREAPLKVVVGQDTRESSQWIADTLAAGLTLADVGVESAGVATTPEVAFLARSEYGAGVVISASHNPWTDNGIKVFASSGYKLPDEEELEIEREIFRLLEDEAGMEKPAALPSSLPGDTALRSRYEKWLVGQAGAPPAGLRLVVDCANGAASALARDVLGGWGVQAEFIHHQPDGRNINANCGALHPEVVARAVVARGADMGITFDGDADRALFSDARGNVVNGDAVLLLAAREMRARGTLRGDTVVATTMSNMGLEKALATSGIRLLRAPVGDKYVLELMQKLGATLGGEQSGHIIFRDGESTTGDGLLTALRVLEIAGRSGKTLAELAADLKNFPQTIRNVRVREKVPLEQVPEVMAEVQKAERLLDSSGRINVRYSGTEKLCRVMVEAETEELMRQVADSVTGAVERALGI